MVWNDEAHEHMVYGAQRKDLVLPFVENHNTHGRSGSKFSSMEDVIFQALSKEARETLWRKLLDRMPEAKALQPTDDISEARPLDEEDIKELSAWQLNGREIKNAVEMVRSWCDHEGYLLTLDRLESGIKVTSPHTNSGGDVD